MPALSIPARYQPFQQFLDDQLDHFWRAPNGDRFTEDRSNWREMDTGVRHRVKICIHLLAYMDIEIIDNIQIITDLVAGVDADTRIIGICLDAQKLMEGVHTLAYDRIDRELEHELTPEDMSCIGDKVHQLGTYRDKDVSTQLVAQVCAEGISFVTLFPIFYYLRKMGILPETCTINDEVLRDENMHTKTFITMYKVFSEDKVIPTLPENEVHAIIRDFVSVEDRLAETIYGRQGDTERAFFTVMTASNSKTYTRIIANTVLKSLGYSTIYDVHGEDNPFPFVDQGLINTLVGFFDRESAEYGIRTDHYYDSDSDPDE